MAKSILTQNTEQNSHYELFIQTLKQSGYDSLDEFTNKLDTITDQVNNIIVVKPILSTLLPESPKQIEDNTNEVFKAFNNIPKQKNEVINSIGNEITKKIEELGEIKSEEISHSKKKNTWLWWWPW